MKSLNFSTSFNKLGFEELRYAHLRIFQLEPDFLEEILLSKTKISSFCHNFDMTNFKNYYSLEGKVAIFPRRKKPVLNQRAFVL